MPAQREPQNLTGRKPKVKPKQPPEVVADLGTAVASGTKRPHRKSEKLPPEVIAAATDQPVEKVRKARRHYKRTGKGTQTSKARAESPSPQEWAAHQAALAADELLRGKTHDKTYNYARNKRGEIKLYGDRPTGPEAFLQAATGINFDDPSKTNALEVAASLAPIPAFKAAKAGQAIARGARALNTAEKAAEATRIIERAKTARKAERAAARAAEATKAAKVRTTAKQFSKQARRRLAKEEAKAAARRSGAKYADRAVQSATSPAVAAASASPSDVGKRTRAAIEGHVNALIHNPLETTKTTTRAILGAPVALAGDAIDIATGHPEKVADELIDYGKTVAKLASGDPAKVERVVTNKVGLVPAATAVFGGGAIARRVRRARGKAPRELPSIARRRYERDVATLSDPKATPKAKKDAADRIKDPKSYGQPLPQRHRANKQEAVRADVAKQRDQGQYAREIREGAKRRHGRREPLPSQVARLHRRKLTPKVSEADALQFLGRHGLRADDPRTVEALVTLRDNLRPSRKDIAPYEVATRDVLDALIANPKTITKADVQGALDRFAEIQRQRSIERHSMRTGKRQTTPDPLDERARLLPVAREFDLPLPEQVRPRELTGKTRIRERSKRTGAVIQEPIDRRIRASAKNAQRKARNLRSTADELQAQGRTTRAAILRDRAQRYEVDAEAQLAVVDRFRRADNLERQSHRKLAAGKITDAEAQSMRADADRLRQAGLADQAERRQRSAEVITQRLQAENRNEPVYFGQEDVAASAKNPNTGVRRSRNAIKEKLSTGELERQGRVNESALTLLRRNRHGRAQLAELERQAAFIDSTFRRTNGQRFLTDREVTAARMTGQIAPGIDAIPVQEVSAAIQRSDALRAELHAKRLEVQGTHPNDPQTLYALAPRANIEQYAAQSKVLEREWQTARTVMHAQSLAMLATSPQWFAWQTVATPLTIAMRHQDPRRYYRAARMAIQAHRELPKETRVAFRAWFQSNPLDTLAIGDVAAGLDKATTHSMNKAMDAALNKTPMGGVVRGLGTSLKQGGPLMQAIGRYEGALRYFNGLLELDRQSGLNLKGELRPGTRVHNFVVGVSRGAVQEHKLLRALQGKNAVEQIEYLASREGRKAMEDLANTTYDNVGNWGALTRTEKKASAVGAFYGFLRMSLHTIFIGYPRNNPVKAAILANLGAQNSIELKELLGGDPSFFSQFGQTVTHVGGERQILDLSRALPSGNALLEAAGNQNASPLAAALAVNPLANVIATSQFGKTTSGQEPAQGTTKGDLLLKGLVGLNPLTREVLRDHVGPAPSQFAQLFRAIEAADSTEGPLSNASIFLPDIIDDPRSQQDAVKLSKLMDKAFAIENFPSPSQIPVRGPEHKAYLKAKRESNAAWKEIDRMLVLYGVKSEKQLKQEERQRDERISVNQFGNKPKPKVRPRGDSIFSSGGEPVFSGSGGGQSVFGGGSGEPIFK